ncbi:hypothetical protein D0809_30705, partial [Flavobacterium circumlabens]
PQFYTALSEMKPVEGNTFSDAVWTLENKGKSYLFYLKNDQDISVDLAGYKGTFEVYAINASTGALTKKASISGGKKIVIPKIEIKEKVLFIVKKS